MRICLCKQLIMKMIFLKNMKGELHRQLYSYIRGNTAVYVNRSISFCQQEGSRDCGENSEGMQRKNEKQNATYACINLGEAYAPADIQKQSIGCWKFSDWETMFVAMVDNQIVGMVSLMKTDYYPLPEIYPWISSVFVTEEYRGHRVSERLIEFANDYAKENGFYRTYIPSEHIGLYEQYGYHYLKDIVNYGNGTDRLYVKELK